MAPKSRTPKTQETLETHSPSEFAAAITRVAVAQICRAAGFSASQPSALQTLTRVAALYLQALATSAASRATVCGRTQTNLFDVVHALEFLDSVRGFPGASDADQPLLSSKTLKKIIHFVHSVQEIPFAKPIPRRDHSGATYSTRRSTSSSQNSNNSEIDSRRLLLSHIPKWLPAFPDPESYEIAEKERCYFEVNWTPCLAERSSPEVSAKVLDDRKRDLPAKRARVRFKMGAGAMGGKWVGMGMDWRNGVCRGGNRVLWHCPLNEKC